MRLTSVEVQGFRGFNQKRTFPLADVNVLGGPNGFGKTSFFDAVLWCLFESIPRLSGTRDFVKAGNIYENKFSAGQCFVKLTFESPDGDLSLRRGLPGVEARVAGKKIDEREFLERLNLQDGDAINRFLRNFLLQQERVNDFVRDLNPRGRYESMASMLEFREPTALRIRLDALISYLGSVRETMVRDLNATVQRREGLQSDLEELEALGSSTSSEVLKRQYDAILVGIAPDLVSRLGLDPQRASEGPLLGRVLSLVAASSEALASLTEVEAQLDGLARLRPGDGVAEQLDLEREVDTLVAKMTVAQNSLATVEEDLARARNEVAAARERARATLQAQDRARAALAAVRAIVVSDHCPVCLRPIEQKTLFEIVDREIGASAQSVASSQLEVSRLEVAAQGLETEVEKLGNSIREQQANLNRLRRVLEARRSFDSARERLRSSAIVQRCGVFSDDVNLFSSNVRSLRAKVEIAHRQAIELSATLDRLNAMSLLPIKRSELERLTNEAARARLSLNDWESRAAIAQRCKDTLSEAQAAVLRRTFDLHRPLIRSLYQRMHPHPLFTDIDFEISLTRGGGELYFKVFTPQRKIDAYPSTVFSTSQLNVLAVSVFLALNLRAESPVPLVMLDDPIHSMDDLNVLGFCDVVRQLKGMRQLFISTHSKDLYELVLSKLRPTEPNESAKGFWFSSWSEEGPAIREDVSEYLRDGVDWTLIEDSLAATPAERRGQIPS